MSLLNQVLQDLEKRNTETNSRENLSFKTKLVNLPQQSSSYVLLILLGIALLYIAIDLFKEKPPASVVVNQQPKTFIKQPDLANKDVLSKKVPVKKPTKVSSIKPKKANKKLKPRQLNPQSLHTKTPKKVAKLNNKNPTTHQVKPLDNKQKAEQLFAETSQQQNQNYLRTNLEFILQLDPEHLKARLHLIKILLLQGLTTEASKNLDNGLEIFPRKLSLINLRSQLYLQNKQTKQALIILQKVNPKQVQDETYLSLLAAAYQQNDENLKSLKTYQKLLLLNPQQAKYWLGLAVAWEKQSDKKQALIAYQQALNKRTLSAAIEQYIQQRIIALN